MPYLSPFYCTENSAFALDREGVITGLIQCLQARFGARVPQDVIARLDISAGKVKHVDVFQRVVLRNIGFASHVQIDRSVDGGGQFLDGLFVAGQPVVGLVLPGCAARPADEGIVIRILIGMQSDVRHDPGGQDCNNE